MSQLSWLLLGAAAAVAALDWIAVARKLKPLEYACKPLTMVALIGVALTLSPASGAERALFIVALGLGLAGDIFLMLPRDMFAAGLAAFLLGHLAYIGGFAARGVQTLPAAIAIVVLAIPAVYVLRLVLAGIRARVPALSGPVLVYAVVILAMAGCAAGTLEPLAAVGALLFICSDGMIALSRFVTQRGWMPVAIIVTYHAGQALLVLSLVQPK